MPYTIQSPSHGLIHFSDNIPAQLKDIVRPGAGAVAAEGKFGDFLVQEFKEQDFTITMNYIFPKEDFTLSQVQEGPAVRILIVLKGQLYQKIGDLEPTTIKEMQCEIVYLPRPTTIETVCSGKGLRFFTLWLSTKMLQEINKECTFPKGVMDILQANTVVPLLQNSDRLPHIIYFEVQELFSHQMSEKNCPFYYRLYAKILVVLVIYQLSGKTGRQIPGRDIDAVLKARDLIDQNLSDIPSGEQLATQVNLSYRRLNKSFKQMINMTIPDYIKTVRLDLAKELLFDKEKNLKEIASQCGYRSTDAFITAFRRRFHISPDALRKSSF